jgi:hypothetical protein
VLGDALRLAHYGRPSFPCLANKRPTCPSGSEDATAEPEELRELWRQFRRQRGRHSPPEGRLCAKTGGMPAGGALVPASGEHGVVASENGGGRKQ